MDDARLYAACGRHGTDEQTDAFAVLWEHLYRIAYAMLREHPDARDLAAECTQQALIKIHRNLGQCLQPEVFRAWAARIARRTVLDTLRQRQRLAPLPDHDQEGALPPSAVVPPPEPPSNLRAELERAIHGGALSDRSRRVVVGRFFAEQSDEALAAEESRLGGKTLLPSHIQVTRAKNLAKLRKDAALLERLRELLGE